MTDSTAHNLVVVQDVCAELETASLPGSLICHVHSMMMFLKKLSKCSKKFMMYL